MRRALAASRVGCCESVAARRLFHLAREALAFRDMDFLRNAAQAWSRSSGVVMWLAAPAVLMPEGYEVEGNGGGGIEEGTDHTALNPREEPQRLPFGQRSGVGHSPSP